MLHPSCNLTSNTDKTHHGLVIALFSVQLQLPCNQHSSLLLTDGYSANYNTRSICDTLFDLWRSSELPQKLCHHCHSNRKWLKQPQIHFHWVVPHKSRHFLLLWCILYTVTPDISSSSQNINSTARVSRLSFRFLWLWFNLSWVSWYS